MNEVITKEATAIVPTPLADNPIQQALEALRSGVDPATLGQLMDLQERWSANNARKSFAAAMAQFKQTAPEILKDKHVKYANKTGGFTEYDHATLGGVVTAIIKGLGDVGISHRWVVDQSTARIKVTCILTHVDGHSETTELSAAADDSGGKNSIQAIASTVSYLQRYTVLAATGLATNDMDDDGVGAGEPIEKITDRQAADLQAKAEEVGADKNGFLKYLRVERLADLPASKFKAAIDVLNQRAKDGKRAK